VPGMVTPPTRCRVAHIIANPTAGQVDSNLVAELVGLCQSRVAELHVVLTAERGDAGQAAAEAVLEGVDVVIAVGGDGTVFEVVQGLIEAGKGAELPSLLVVPGGTGNSSYLAQWGRLDWREAVVAALSGIGADRRLLDLAMLVELDELVLLGACSGLIAEALTTARSVPVAGPERYRIALAQTAIGFAPYPGRVLVDGLQVHSGATIFANVGGGRFRGGTYQLLPHSILDDGLLDVCVVGSPVVAVDVPELTLSGGHLDHPGVVYARGSRITLERTDGAPISFEHDGELKTAELASITLQVMPRALPVLCRTGLVGLQQIR
jgi:diacylglycerol kinase (ATP)